MIPLLLVALAQALMMPTTLARGTHSGIDEPRQVVVRSAAELEALWKEFNGPAPVPAVDFSDHVVAAVFLGMRPTGGYGVEITGARRDGSTLVVDYRERRPDPGDIVTQALTTPFHVVSLPAHDGPVRFDLHQ